MPVGEGALRILAALIEARAGQPLTVSRHWRVETVLQPLIRERGFESVDALAAAIVGGREEALSRAVVEALLNNETFFFRDRHAFDLLLGPALSRLRASRSAVRRLSIWCAGCSTGQEPYSIAMHFAEQAARWEGWKIDIVGTDVSAAAIAQARAGLYSQFEVQRGLPVLQMIRWFEQKPGGQWQIGDLLRRSVRFEVRPLAQGAPGPGRFDIILCRNVLLYFSDIGRRLAFERLAEAAVQDAVLMLGAGETVGRDTGAFRVDGECRSLYLRAASESRGLRAAS